MTFIIRNIIIGYVSVMPIIITALLNAIFCKTSFFQFLKVPIDGGKVLKDGIIGFLIKVYDQVDSIVGIMLIVALAGKMSCIVYLCYIIVGGITHVMLNCLLYAFKLRDCIL